MVGKCVSKENPKSDLDLDSGFVNNTIELQETDPEIIRQVDPDDMPA